MNYNNYQMTWYNYMYFKLLDSAKTRKGLYGDKES